MAELSELWIEMIAGQVKFSILLFFVQFLISLKNSFYFKQQYFAIERFCNIIVCAQLISLYDVFFHRFCTQKEKRNVRIHISNFFGESEAIHIWHHNIQQAQIK